METCFFFQVEQQGRSLRAVGGGGGANDEEEGNGMDGRAGGFARLEWRGCESRAMAGEEGEEADGLAGGVGEGLGKLSMLSSPRCMI